jgi:hypothetical protein
MPQKINKNSVECFLQMSSTYSTIIIEISTSSVFIIIL